MAELSSNIVVRYDNVSLPPVQTLSVTLLHIIYRATRAISTRNCTKTKVVLTVLIRMDLKS